MLSLELLGGKGNVMLGDVTDAVTTLGRKRRIMEKALWLVALRDIVVADTLFADTVDTAIYLT